MSVQLQMEQMPGYLAARFTGVGVPEEVWRQYELIVKHCKGAKNNKLLIDTTGAEGEVSDVERFQFAERLEIFARCGIKVALACRPEHIHPRRYGVLFVRISGHREHRFRRIVNTNSGGS